MERSVSLLGRAENHRCREYTKERFAEIPGATFSDGRYYRFPVDIQIDEVEADTLTALGIPNLGVFGLLQGAAAKVYCRGWLDLG